jgi:hypothetical protein
MEEVSYLEKKGFNDHFKYSFLSEADCKAAVSAAFRKHGLVLGRTEVEPVGEITGKAAVVRVRLLVADVDGEASEPWRTAGVTFEGVGAGSDSSDKAPMKATAAAIKYALTTAFLIATGDDPEKEANAEDLKSGRKIETGARSSAPKSAAKTAADEADEPARDAAGVLKAIERATTVEHLSGIKLTLGKMLKDPQFPALKKAYLEKQQALANAAQEQK